MSLSRGSTARAPVEALAWGAPVLLAVCPREGRWSGATDTLLRRKRSPQKKFTYASLDGPTVTLSDVTNVSTVDDRAQRLANHMEKTLRQTHERNYSLLETRKNN